MKQERLDIRTSSSERRKFEAAATLLGMNVSSFLRMSALEKSTEVLKQHDTIVLSDEARDAFLEALEHPPKPNKALKQALKNYRRLVKRG